MDHGHFDELTRSVGGDGGTRRALLRLLTGSALGGLIARLGLAEDAAAKPKKHKAKAKSRPKRPSQPERTAQGQLQAEGKGKGKGKGHKKPKPDPDEGCSDVIRLCGQCEEAICVAGDWICKVLGDKDCGGGVCVWDDQCCPNQKRCPGYTECFAKDDCCPGAVPPLCAECEKVVCEGGSLHCRPKSHCCPAGTQECPDGQCVPEDRCCPGYKLCINNCILDDACCPADGWPECSSCEEVVCEGGEYVCQPRPNVKPCPDGSCVALDTCCPDDQPQCGTCEVLACENGQAVCKDNMEVCGPGGEPDPETCRCKYCEETCDPETGMCHSNCPEGYRCEEGKCLRVCDSPIRPQLCCVEEFPGQVRCICRWINEICYPCATGGICACVPGQSCCAPDDVRVGSCPQACREAEICQHCEGPYCP